MSDLKELKPCPFCNGKAIQGDGHEAWYTCSECGAATRLCENLWKAEELWNTRASLSAPEREWRPVSEMPIGEPCLCFAPIENGSRQIFVATSYFKSGYTAFGATHFMPLPPTPKPA
jgi:hypothetical protein